MRNPTPRYTPEFRQQMVELYRGGWSFQACSRVATMCQVLKISRCACSTLELGWLDRGRAPTSSAYSMTSRLVCQSSLLKLR